MWGVHGIEMSPEPGVCYHCVTSRQFSQFLFCFVQYDIFTQWQFSKRLVILTLTFTLVHRPPAHIRHSRHSFVWNIWTGPESRPCGQFERRRLFSHLHNLKTSHLVTDWIKEMDEAAGYKMEEFLWFILFLLGFSFSRTTSIMDLQWLAIFADFMTFFLTFLSKGMFSNT